jgi:hypothetical protein
MASDPGKQGKFTAKQEPKAFIELSSIVAMLPFITGHSSGSIL